MRLPKINNSFLTAPMMMGVTASFALVLLLISLMWMVFGALADREVLNMKVQVAALDPGLPTEALGGSIRDAATTAAWLASAGLLALYVGLAGASAVGWRMLRRGRHELNRTRELLGSVVEHTDDAIMTASLDGAITSWNAAAERLFGYRPSEVIGRHRSFMVPESRAYEPLETAMAFRFGRSVEGRETVRLHRDGREIPVSLTSSPLRDERGRVIGASAIMRDNSDVKHEEERRSTFISVASHELRTPLTSVLGFSELLLDRTPEEDVRTEWVTAIHAEADRMHAIISELLDISTIQSGHLELDMGSVAVADVVAEVTSKLRPAMGGRLLIAACADDLPDVTADGAKLVRVITNLLDNAIKYSPGRLPVIISAEAISDGDSVMISVIDHGVGIADEDLLDLFGSFHRIRNDRTREVGGAGLGLHITKALVEAMGARIDVDSQPGRGSKFMVTLPVASEGSEPGQPDAAAA